MVRTIIISGGTSGIGLAAAKILSREGARTILLGRDTERGKKAEESVPGSLYVPCDVTKTDDCEKAVKGLLERLRALSFLPASMKRNFWRIRPMRI